MLGTGSKRVLSAILMSFGCLGLASCAPQGGAPNAAAVAPSQPQSAAPAVTDPAGATSNGSTQTTALAAPPQSALASGSDYRVMPGDILQINVFQVQDFNRDVQVDAAGNVVLPLIGAVPVAGKTVRDVESDIARRLKAKYLQNPQVLVAVKDAVGLRVAVQGAVKTPGVLPIRGGTTLTNVIAQAQGFTDTADKSSVLIIRNTDQGRVAAKVDAGAILEGSAPDPPVYGGDTVVVNDSFVRVAGKDALTVLTGAAAVRLLFP
jgi:protein involved in polysaccharide export with SLBB domain